MTKQEKFIKPDDICKTIHFKTNSTTMKKNYNGNKKKSISVHCYTVFFIKQLGYTLKLETSLKHKLSLNRTISRYMEQVCYTLGRQKI